MTRKFARRILVACCLIAIAQIATAKEPASKKQADQPQIAAITQRMQQFAKEGQISGAVTLVAKDGKIVHLAATDLADVANNKPMRPDSLFAIASMTKPITATGVMVLQDEGKLSIDDPISKYIPEFKDVQLNGASPPRAITIRDAITHTSGLAGNQQTEGTLAETAVALAKRPLAFEPGTKWQYSPGLNVCGRVIEVASGQPYDEFLRRRIFEPLEMKDTAFVPTKKQQKRVVKLYQPGKEKGTIEETAHWLQTETRPNPSGGLYSTAADLARFYQMVLNGGERNGKRIVSSEAVKQMTTIQTGELVTGFTPGNGWGLGWCVVREPQGPTKSLSPGTFGHGGAFGTQGWVDPVRKMVFVLLIQRTNFGNSDGSDIRGDFHDLAVEGTE